MGLKCDLCMQERPIDEYENIDSGIICKWCMEGKEAPVQTQKALTDKARSMGRQLSDLDGATLPADTGKVRGVLGRFYENYGGPSRFADDLYDTLQELKQRRPVPTAVGHIQLGILKLHHALETTEHEADARHMSDEQLARETEVAMLKIIVDAAESPKKTQVLNDLLARKGLSLSQMDGHEMMDAISHQVEELEDVGSSASVATGTGQAEPGDFEGLPPGDPTGSGPSEQGE